MIKCELVELQPQATAVVRELVPMKELTDFFGRAFQAVMAETGAHGVFPVGPPFGYYKGMPTDVVDVSAGFPTSKEITPTGVVSLLLLPGGRAVTATHVGPYDTMSKTYEEVTAWMSAEGLKPADFMWEVYLSNPETEPDQSTWRTQIVWPVA